MIKKHSLEEILLMIEDLETHNVEFKSSYCVSLIYDAPDGKSATRTLNELKTECRVMLAKECGAFANSDGGTLIIGVYDDGSIDPNPIPELHNNRVPIHIWMESLIRDCTQPPIESFECYSIIDSDKNRFLIVQVPPSEKSPHQSSEDLRYYIRTGKSALPAEHWWIEMIRDRRIHPKIESKIIYEESKFYKLDNSNLTASLDLIFRFTNTGSVIANHWAVKLDCPHSTGIEIFPKGLYEDVKYSWNQQTNILMFQSSKPFFPKQSIDIMCRIACSGYYQLIPPYNREIRKLGWWGDADASLLTEDIGGTENDIQWFNINLTNYSDSATPLKETHKVINTELYNQAYIYLKANSLITY